MSLFKKSLHTFVTEIACWMFAKLFTKKTLIITATTIGRGGLTATNNIKVIIPLTIRHHHPERDTKVLQWAILVLYHNEFNQKLTLQKRGSMEYSLASFSASVKGCDGETYSLNNFFRWDRPSSSCSSGRGIGVTALPSPSSDWPWPEEPDPPPAKNFLMMFILVEEFNKVDSSSFASDHLKCHVSSFNANDNTQTWLN